MPDATTLYCAASTGPFETPQSIPVKATNPIETVTDGTNRDRAASGAENESATALRMSGHRRLRCPALLGTNPPISTPTPELAPTAIPKYMPMEDKLSPNARA